MTLNVGSIVEGYGEVAAVPVLLRRIQYELDLGFGFDFPRPERVGRAKVVQPGELERAVERLSRRLAAPRAILILIDADKDCPAELGPKLLARAEQARPDIPIGVVLAKFEFEAWFLAAIESLPGWGGLPQDLVPVPDPEAVQGAKEFLRKQAKGSPSYTPTADQAALTALFDMEMARRNSPSFDKCWKKIERLFSEVSQQKPENRPQSG